MKETIKNSSDKNAEFTNNIRDELRKIKTLTDTHEKRESDLETLDSLSTVQKSHEKLTRQISRLKEGSDRKSVV